MSKFTQEELYVDGDKKYVIVTSIEGDSATIATKTRVTTIALKDFPGDKPKALARVFVGDDGEFSKDTDRRNASTTTGRAGCAKAAVSADRYAG